MRTADRLGHRPAGIAPADTDSDRSSGWDWDCHSHSSLAVQGLHSVDTCFVFDQRVDRTLAGQLAVVDSH